MVLSVGSSTPKPPLTMRYFRHLFETETVLKSIFLAKAYERGLSAVWNDLYRTEDWLRVLRSEKQILLKINQIPSKRISWLDLVNLYGFLIGEHVYHVRRWGLSQKLVQVPGNHPHQLTVTDWKGFDTTIERGGRLTSYFATYAIEGVCTFSYVALRSENTPEKVRRKLLRELNHPVAETRKKLILKEKKAIQEIRLLEKTVREMSKVSIERDTPLIVRYTRRIISSLLSSIKKWIYTTYAETSKRHGWAIKRMSGRFSHGILLSPDFEVNRNGEIAVRTLPFYDPMEGTLKSRQETFDFLREHIVPRMKNQDYKQLIHRHCLNP